jgi:cyanophycin synthetase
MRFIKIQALRGPNLWADYPVMEAWLDLEGLQDSSSDSLPGFNDRLKNWLPSLVEHRCSEGARGGFFQRLDRGTYQGHILEHVALELQSLAGTPAGYGRTRHTHKEGVYRVVIEYELEELARASLEAALELCLAAVHDRPFNVEENLARLREVARRSAPPRDAALVQKSARWRGLPCRLLEGGVLLLGHGVKQRRMLGSLTDSDGALADMISRDNELTLRLLRGAGIPVPESRLVSTAEEAWTAAQELSLPVLLRPHRRRRKGARGKLTTREEVYSAFERAYEFSYRANVERFIDGASWRIVVVGGKVEAAVRRDYDAREVHDTTDQIHPETAQLAVEAAAVVGLRVAGVDVVAADLRQPLGPQGGAITGVAAGPGLKMHRHPTTGEPRRVARAVLDHLFGDTNGRIPVAAVTGVNGKSTTTRLLAHILGHVHDCVGMTCTDGIWVKGRKVGSGDCSGPASAQVVLQHPQVEAAVLETARGGILRAGLGFDRCDVAVVTNIGQGDHLGLNNIETVEDLARVKRCIVEVVLPEGAAVLNAADPLVVEMASWCPGSAVFFARDAQLPVMAAHRAAGGRTAFARDGRLILAEGDQEIPVAMFSDIPLTCGGRVHFQVENVLAAAAAAWSLGVPCQTIRLSLESFRANMCDAPGRFNLLEVNGATVILDYGHNVSALQALIPVIEGLPHRRRLAVYSAAGDRRDSDMIEQGRILGEHFDQVILYEDHYLRGRQSGEIIGLFRQGLVQGSRTSAIDGIQGGVAAVEMALSLAGPGDLLLIQADVIEETVNFVRDYLSSHVQGHEIDFDQAVRLGQAKLAKVKG